MIQRMKALRLDLLRVFSLGWIVADLYWPASSLAASSIVLAPATMMRLGSVDERFQSYNIEMVEVTGGYFWRPYGDDRKTSSSPIRRRMPAGMNLAMYAYRKPIDLSNARLRKLAAALGPAYLRVSGTWANATYFDDGDGRRTSPPAGFNGVLTRERWKGVIDFAHAVDAKLVTSFATSAGTRDARGVWRPVQANKLVAATLALGGMIAAAEFMNEPDLAAMGGAPAGYDATSYGRDMAAFRSFLRQASPQTVLLGPGTISEGGGDSARGSERLLAASGAAFDGLSYHHYGMASQRCTKAVPSAAARDEDALSQDRLLGAERAEAFYAGLRDKYMRGKALWITETADASCGGNPWDKTFLDSFRYLDQLGRIAQLGVQVVMHNTLAASDYGLLDEGRFAPRPNYWAALLWRKLMGTIVLEPGTSSVPRLQVYAHCLRGKRGGVALLAINKDRVNSQSFDLPIPARRHTLTAAKLTDKTIQMNGRDVRLGARDELPSLEGEPVAAGRLELAPASITFLAIADAANPACQ
jgi:heparanase 1